MFTIKNDRLRKALDKAGFRGVELIKDDGFFWFTEPEGFRVNYSTAVYVNNFSDMTISEWVDAAKECLIKDDEE